MFALLGIVVTLVQWSGTGQAAPASIIIDERSPALLKRDGGGWTTLLGFTNLTDSEMVVVVEPADKSDKGCSPNVDKPSLPSAQHSKVMVTVPPGCKVADDGIDLKANVSAGDSLVLVFDVTAAPKPTDSAPEWGALKAFPIALGVLLIGALLLYIVWDALDKSNHRFNQQLNHLDKTWSFKDSWVSNITVAAGLLTGIFGASNVVKALLGKDAEQSIALAIVGAAVATAFIGAGPIILLATKAKGTITVGGLLIASAFILTGAFGELWVAYRSASHLDLGGWESNLWIPLLAACFLLSLYAIRSTIEALELGTTTPEKPPASDTLKAAALITEALRAAPGVNVQDLDMKLAKVREAYPDVHTGFGTSTGDDYPARRRAAAL